MLSWSYNLAGGQVKAVRELELNIEIQLEQQITFSLKTWTPESAGLGMHELEQFNCNFIS